MENNTNYTGLFGVDVAIKKLRPGAEFALYNTTFTAWECPNGTAPPTWEEITEQMEADIISSGASSMASDSGSEGEKKSAV